MWGRLSRHGHAEVGALAVMQEQVWASEQGQRRTQRGPSSPCQFRQQSECGCPRSMLCDGKKQEVRTGREEGGPDGQSRQELRVWGWRSVLAVHSHCSHPLRGFTHPLAPTLRDIYYDIMPILQMRKLKG